MILLTGEAAAERMGVNRQRFNRWVNNGFIEPTLIRSHNRRYFDSEYIDSLNVDELAAMWTRTPVDQLPDSLVYAPSLSPETIVERLTTLGYKVNLRYILELRKERGL